MVELVRRVVTGIDRNGISVFLEEEASFTMEHPSGVRTAELWRTVAPFRDPAEGGAPGDFRVAPLPGGTLFRAGIVPPEDGLKPENFRMHRTATIDYGVVLSGEIWLRLDSGVEAHLRVGDCVVQRGTPHAWRNYSQAPCVMVFASVATGQTTSVDSPDTP